MSVMLAGLNFIVNTYFNFFSNSFFCSSVVHTNMVHTPTAISTMRVYRKKSIVTTITQTSNLKKMYTTPLHFISAVLSIIFQTSCNMVVDFAADIKLLNIPLA